MVRRAILVWDKNRGITCADATIFDKENPEQFSYSAVQKIFVLTKKKSVKGGLMYMDAPPTLQDCAAVAEAELSKIVYRGDGEGKDFTAGQQLLAERGIEVEHNDGIILYGDEI